jgi:hypothetical protein
MQTLPQDRGTDVDEQPNGHVRQLEISQELPAVNRCQPLHRFEFHHDPVLDQEIRTEAFLDHHLMVFETDWLLPAPPRFHVSA